MLKNRSAPPALIVPVLTVSDVKAATDWYVAAFGMLEHVRIGTHRAQLGLGGFALIVAEPRPCKPVFMGQSAGGGWPLTWLCHKLPEYPRLGEWSPLAGDRVLGRRAI